MTQPDDKKKDQKKKQENDETALPPDPETLHKTDPQENMKGPISSAVNKVAESIEKNDKEDPEDKK